MCRFEDCLVFLANAMGKRESNIVVQVQFTHKEGCAGKEFKH